MERGFKTRCEEMSRSLRTELGLGSDAPYRLNNSPPISACMFYRLTT